MAEVKATLKQIFKAGRSDRPQRDILRQSDVRELATAIKRIMLDLISKGISPIRGGGIASRFPGYKAVEGAKAAKKSGSTTTPKKGYPASVRHKFSDKRDRPVNLRLSGQMLGELVLRAVKGKTGFGLEVGYFDPDAAKKESGHANGVNGQPKRPTIPSPAKGQRFVAQIETLVIEKIRERTKQLLRGAF